MKTKDIHEVLRWKFNVWKKQQEFEEWQRTVWLPKHIEAYRQFLLAGGKPFRLF